MMNDQYGIPMTGLNVGILVDGQELIVYSKDGRYFVAGQPGKAYAIRVDYQLPGRVEVVESVDGRNVLKDEAASFACQGMVIRDTWVNKGWRIDDKTTRDFVFTDPAASIAAQAGAPSGVGVIGVAVWREKMLEHQRYVFSSGRRGGISKAFGEIQERMDSASPASWDAADIKAVTSAAPDLGTGMGQARADAVGRTSFARNQAQPDYTVEIQYRTEAWLVKEGIIDRNVYPSAWPSGATGYEKYIK